MKNLSDFIMVIDNALSPDFCKDVIQYFEASSDSLVNRDSEWLSGNKSFKELCITDVSFHEPLLKVSNEIYKQYSIVKNIKFFPPSYGMEEVRMKRYDNNGKDNFGWHTDVGDYASARRFLVMFYYLNDVIDGGQTMFSSDMNDESAMFVRPTAGRVVVFPPTFQYPHKGAIPISNPKYIISTYFHYL
jgi:prolyl 4-hydroxylase